MDFAVCESFRRRNLVFLFCCSQTVSAERVVVTGGNVVFASVVAWAQSFLANDVFAFDAPVSGASEEIPYDGEFQFRHWWGEERGRGCLVPMGVCRGCARRVDCDFGSAFLEGVPFWVLLFGIFF